MKIKRDENLPTTLARALTALGHDTDTVPQEGMAGKSEEEEEEEVEVWAAAQAARRFLITQDLDFSNIHRFTPGTHEGIVLVRLRTPGRAALTSRIHAVFQAESTETWRGAFVVVTDHKLRVRHPPDQRP